MGIDSWYYNASILSDLDVSVRCLLSQAEMSVLMYKCGSLSYSLHACNVHVCEIV